MKNVCNIASAARLEERKEMCGEKKTNGGIETSTWDIMMPRREKLKEEE